MLTVMRCGCMFKQFANTSAAATDSSYRQFCWPRKPFCTVEGAAWHAAWCAALPAAIMLCNQGDLDTARQLLMHFRQLAAGLGEDAKAADAEMMEQQHALAQLLGVPQGLDG
eukprot:GHRQ01031146.1.p4 GENE.GHRQ01031146.1~~GHRQ01031146.1.p4  ORF type:complete len:112 (+),score=55.04 GHRQ01031146.1:1030-1365(+)